MVKKYKIITTGRSGIKYIYNKKVMNIDSEALVGDKLICIWKDTIRYWTTLNSKELATNEEISMVIDNLEKQFGEDKIEWDLSLRPDWDDYNSTNNKSIDVEKYLKSLNK